MARNVKRSAIVVSRIGTIYAPVMSGDDQASVVEPLHTESMVEYRCGHGSESLLVVRLVSNNMGFRHVHLLLREPKGIHLRQELENLATKAF